VTDPTPERIAELEAELGRERRRSRSVQRRLAAKEQELLEIYRSRAWGFIGTLRSLKYRLLDPLLGMVGVSWPRRRPTAPAPASGAQPLCPRSNPGRYDILCFSTSDWDGRFQRPQQLLSLFADAGHRVFYVSQRFRSDGPAWAAAEKRRNVWEVTLRGEGLNVYTEALGERARALLFEGVDALQRDVSLGADTAMFVHLPFWGPLARQARERFGWPVLYDCMDLLAGFSTVRRAMVAQEEELLAQADVVVTCSSILEQHALRRRKDVLVIRNGCDYEHFANASAPPAHVRPVVGYYGAIADWFDSALVAGLAIRRPDWDFVLVGSTYNADIAQLVRLPNVSLPGEEAYEALPDWLAGFDVTIIPFKRTRLTDASNPVKMYEILAGGKPIVSVPLPEVAALVPLVRIAATVDEFEREIAAALAEDAGAAGPRRAFARENTWEHRFALLAAATAGALARAVPAAAGTSVLS